MSKFIQGHNDLETKYPDIAAEAYGWDPSTVLAGTHQRKAWKCSQGHTWETKVIERTGKSKTGCPFCSNKKAWAGFNDLKTKFPDIAAEAHGWDPSTLVPGSSKKLFWKCSKGHIWKTTPSERTGRDKTGCPNCALFGFSTNKPAWFYLMIRTGEQQIGITNQIKDRIRKHKLSGWIPLDISEQFSGQDVLDTERKFKKWIKENIGLMPGTQENWSSSKLKVNSLSELKKITGIKTSIF